MSAEENDVEKSEEVKALEKETELINAKKSLETAKNDLEKAKVDRINQLIPALPEGNDNNKFTIEDDSQDFEATVLALRSLDNIVEPVIEEIFNNLQQKSGSIIIESGDGVQESVISFFTYIEFEAVIKGLKKEYDTLNEILKKVDPVDTTDSASFIPGIASSATGLLFDLIPLFTTNVEFKKAKVTVEEESFIARLVNKIKSDNRSSNISFYYPDNFPIFSIKEAEDILKRFRNLENSKKQFELVIKSKNREINDKNTSEEIKKRLREEVEKIGFVNMATEEFLESFKIPTSASSSGNTNGSSSNFIRLLQGQKISNLKKSGDIFYLNLSVQGGGSVKIARNFFVKKRRVNAASVVTYFLYDEASQLLNGNEHIVNTGFVKVPRIIPEVPKIIPVLDENTNSDEGN